MSRMSTADTSPTVPSLSDEELMSQLAAGRQDALGPLHGRYAALVFNLAAQSLDSATAEEIVQDVFVAVWLVAVLYLHERSGRDHETLRLVTSSDVVPRRMTAAAGTPTATHGNYRGRPGVPMAVLTFSYFAPPPPGLAYQAWGEFRGR